MSRTAGSRGKAKGPKRRRRWGGYRPGAGRKPKGEVSGVAHVSRPRLGRGALALVTLGLARDVPDPREARAAAVVRQALAAAGGAAGCSVLHASLHRRHLHLILRVAGHRALSRAMTGVSVHLACGLNRLARRRGAVFADRYEVRELVGALALRAARRDPCAWRSPPERTTHFRPATCPTLGPRSRVALRLDPGALHAPLPPRRARRRPGARRSALHLVSSAMRARKTGPSSAAFLSPTPLIARNSSLVRGFLADSSARVRSLKIR